jgi:hypothetical protein
MQPLPTVTSKGCKSHFLFDQFRLKQIPFILRINISFTYLTFLKNCLNLKIDLEPLG